MELKKWLMDARVLLGMLVVQVVSAGGQILARVILKDGTFVFALVTYRHIIAAISVAPFALYYERGVVKKLNFVAFFWLFIVALTGISMAMGLFYYGMKDTTATYATNFLNLIPIVTFLFSIILRVEKLGLQTRAGKIRSLGAILCLGGALTIALYKGKSFYLTHHHHTNNEVKIIDQTLHNKTRGTLFLVGCCLSYGTWFVALMKLFKVFPYNYWATMMTCIIASVQSAIFGLCIDRRPKSWHLGWNLELVTILYSGILATAASFCMIQWTITQRGPTYPSMFNPVSLILVAIAEALFLGQSISAGSVIGMILIIVGLYSFLWGNNSNIIKQRKAQIATAAAAAITTASGGEVLQSSSAIVVPAALPLRDHLDV